MTDIAEPDPKSAPKRRATTSYSLSISLRSAIVIGSGLMAAFFLVGLARSLPDTLTRFGLGLVLAFALDPVVVAVRNRLSCRRGTAVAIVGAVAVAAFAALVFGVGPSAVSEATRFSSDLPQTVDKLQKVPVVGDLITQFDVSNRVQEWVANLPAQIDDNALSQLVASLIGGLVAGLTVLVSGVAVLADGERLIARLQQLVPRRHRDHAILAGRVFKRTIGAYFAGSLFVAALNASFVLVLGLALGVPLTPVAALWVLIVNLIPQIGGFLAASVFTLLALAHSPLVGVVCLVLYVTYNTLENHIIQPAIVGEAVDLSAAATLLAALIGGSAAGVPGAMIATPLVGTVKALYLELKPGAVRASPRKRRLRPRFHRRVDVGISDAEGD